MGPARSEIRGPGGPPVASPEGELCFCTLWTRSGPSGIRSGWDQVRVGSRGVGLAADITEDIVWDIFVGLAAGFVAGLAVGLAVGLASGVTEDLAVRLAVGCAV